MQQQPTNANTHVHATVALGVHTYITMRTSSVAVAVAVAVAALGVAGASAVAPPPCPKGTTSVDTFSAEGARWSACEDLAVPGGAIALMYVLHPAPTRS